MDGVVGSKAEVLSEIACLADERRVNDEGDDLLPQTLEIDLDAGKSGSAQSPCSARPRESCPDLRISHFGGRELRGLGP
jgi:hypothetical protein